MEHIILTEENIAHYRDIVTGQITIFIDDKISINEENQLHSHNDEPGLITPLNSKYWFNNGKVHRTSGPAIIYSTGIREWFLYGNSVINSKIFKIVAGLTDEDMTMLILKYGKI
jgi:hypothetical protein